MSTASPFPVFPGPYDGVPPRLSRLAGRDEVECDAPTIRPRIQDAAGEFGPIVDHDERRRRADRRDRVQRPHHAGGRQRLIDVDGQRFARVHIHEREHAKRSPVGQRGAHEIHRPALVRLLRPRHHGLPCAGADASLASAQRQARRPIDPLDASMIHAHALASQQHGEPARSKARARVRQRHDLVAQAIVRRATGSVPHHRPARPDERAGMAFRVAIGLARDAHGIPARRGRHHFRRAPLL